MNFGPARKKNKTHEAEKVDISIEENEDYTLSLSHWTLRVVCSVLSVLCVCVSAHEAEVTNRARGKSRS